MGKRVWFASLTFLVFGATFAYFAVHQILSLAADLSGHLFYAIADSIAAVGGLFGGIASIAYLLRNHPNIGLGMAGAVGVACGAAAGITGRLDVLAFLGLVPVLTVLPRIIRWPTPSE